MSLNEYEFFNGVVLNRLIRKGKPLKIDIFPSSGSNSFTINGDIGIYIKYSKKVSTPWRFSFIQIHQDEIKIMHELLKNVFVVLVCQKDGIVCLSYNELKKILDENYTQVEWISASRLKRESYNVKGSDGKLKFKITDSSFPKKILDLI